MADIFVVETDEDIYLGTLELVKDGLLVRTGFRGHPFMVRAEDIVRITLAEDHELVDA